MDQKTFLVWVMVVWLAVVWLLGHCVQRPEIYNLSDYGIETEMEQEE